MCCKIIETRIFIENEEVTVYGLEFISENNTVLKRIENIFCEFNKAEELKELINSNDIDISQIDYVIEDFLIN